MFFERIRKSSAIVLSAAMLVPMMASPAFSATTSEDNSAELKRAIKSGRAKNIILFLGDGMGDSEITIARNYHVGAAGRLALDTLPLTGAYTTYAVKETNPALADYVTDSAASGTAWSTGRKTSNGRVSTVAGSSVVASYATILEFAQALGLRTGNVSTAEITDATPAVLASHVNARGCQGPANMSACPAYKKSAGGPGSIAEQLVDHRIDVILGGGQSRFTQVIDGGPYIGKTVIQSALAQGYQYVTNAADLDVVDGGKRVLGLFAPGNMDLEWSGALAQPFPGSGPQKCLEGQRPVNQPSLAAMTTKALDLLERDGKGRQNRRGFFLQVEGASIDKQDHAENPCGQIGETIAFDKAVAVGLEYAKTHPDTLIIVTADHAHTSQIIESVPAAEGVNHPGAFSVLTTADGTDMTVNYATTPHGTSQDHTGSQVRIAAQGPQAANVVGVTDQTDLFHTMMRALGLE
ncbi:MAG TPA: alkaline phosphatase [Terriglobales bacterium]|nr:alkaline phosphatase [Terriglobales bacterium]